MGRDAAAEPAGWLEYFRAASEAAGFTGPGWKAALAKSIDIYDVQIGRWSRAERIPDVDSCRKLARAWNRPVLEVLVAAGHLDPADAQMREQPVPPRALTPQLERLAKLLENPDTPPDVRTRIEAALAATADLVEGSPGSSERAIG